MPGSAHRVALPNVDEHLVRVEEIVDGHGIEPGVELVEEEVFDEAEVDQHADHAVKSAMKKAR